MLTWHTNYTKISTIRKFPAIYGTRTMIYSKQMNFGRLWKPFINYTQSCQEPAVCCIVCIQENRVITGGLAWTPHTWAPRNSPRPNNTAEASQGHLSTQWQNGRALAYNNIHSNWLNSESFKQPVEANKHQTFLIRYSLLWSH